MNPENPELEQPVRVKIEDSEASQQEELESYSEESESELREQQIDHLEVILTKQERTLRRLNSRYQRYLILAEEHRESYIDLQREYISTTHQLRRLLEEENPYVTEEVYSQENPQEAQENPQEVPSINPTESRTGYIDI